MVSQNVCRRRLLAGTSLVALSLSSGVLTVMIPLTARANCGINGTISSNTSEIGWSSGNCTISPNVTLSNYNTQTALLATGSSLGTLTNNGTIAGFMYGMLNAGTIGVVTNNSGGQISGLSVSAAGLRNNGTIGTLTNSGNISAGSSGIWNNGSIGTLINTGTISGNGGFGYTSFNGINNTGRIAELDNDSGGHIIGGSTGIQNSGSIGSLSNSGTITTSGGPDKFGIANDGSGTITALTNNSSGSISGGSTGILNEGIVGTLANSGTISGGSTGIGNSGSIGTLSNSGTISGVTGVGIVNYGGTITTLINESGGSISGNTYGIYNNTGTIGALSNSGTISGRTAIYNSSNGTIGPITNSGLIAGNIVNAASQTLTIDGGSGTIFGTLTGSTGSIGSGDQGTITNTSSNLVFGSGNLLLNDAINVGSNTVVNSGATLKLANPVTITGAYQQTGGGLVAQAASPASYGNLTVTGNATVANASIVISGSGLAGGNSFTIVSAGATGSYTGDSASVIGTSGLTASVQAVGDDLVVTLADTSTPDSFTAKGDAAGGVAAPLGPTLDAINGGSSPGALAFQNAVLVPLTELPAGQQGQAMKQLAPVQTSFQAVDSAATTVLGAIEQHQQTAMAYEAQTGEAAGSGLRPGTLWAQALGGTAQRDSNTEAAGYNSTDFGLAAGLDHLFTPNLLGGVAVSWLRAWTQGLDSASGQSSTLDDYQLTVYGTYRKGRAFVDGHVGAGWNQFNQDRSIAFLNKAASANYDGQQYLVDALAGYDIPVGDLTVTPLVGLRWLRANTGSYTESGAGAADLSVGSQTEDSLTQALGVKASWRLATDLGTLEPEVTAEWVHDYLHGPIATSGVMGGEAFAVTTPRIAADGARISVAATLVKSDRLSFRAEYDGELRAGYQSHTGLLKVLWQF